MTSSTCAQKDHSGRNINNRCKCRKAKEAQRPVRKLSSKTLVRILPGSVVARIIKRRGKKSRMTPSLASVMGWMGRMKER